MAWNGSDQTTSGAPRSRGRISPKCAAPVDATSPSRRKKTNPTAVPLLSRPTFFFLLLLLALAGAAVWYFFLRPVDADSRPRPEKPKKSAPIAEVRPSIVTNRVAKKETPPPKPKKIDPKARPTQVGEVLNGYVMLPSGRLHRRVGVITNTASMRSKPWYRIFKHPCNNELATYLSLKPGDTLVGSREYTGTFKDDFIESLKTPVVVYSDDSPEVAQLKRDVNTARLTLKDALDRGEDIEQIMIDTRTQLQDLKRVKGSIEQVFNESVRKCKTEQDVEDLITASNKMLEEQGIAPLEANEVTKMNILREWREEREAMADGVIPAEPLEQTHEGTQK